MTDLSMVFLVSVIIFTGFSQVLLKVGANKANMKKCNMSYVNPYTLIAFSLYVLTTLLTVYTLKDIPLNLFYASTSLKLVVLILILSKLVLRKKIDSSKAFAVLLILVGVMVFNM